VVPNAPVGRVSCAAMKDWGSAWLSATTLLCGFAAPSCGAQRNGGGDGGAAAGTLVTLASGQLAPQGIAVDRTNVYWTDLNGNTVMSVPIGGGPTTTLASGQEGPFDLALNSTNLYWTTLFGGEVVEVALDGGAAEMVAPRHGTQGQGSVAIANDATSIYWASQDGTILSVGLDGGTPTIVASGQGIDTFGIAVDSTNVYWTYEGTAPDFADGEVRKTPKQRGAITALASGQTAPHGIAVDATSVYWTNSNTNSGPPKGSDSGSGMGTGSVMKVPLEGGSIATLASGQANPTGITVDATNVYWTSGATVMAVGLDGGAVTTLASAQNGAVGIAVDSTSAYWTNSGVNVGGSVVKLTPK
jgi:hypothetical protein